MLTLKRALLLAALLMLSACGGGNTNQEPVLSEADVVNLNLVTNALNTINTLNTFALSMDRTVTQVSNTTRAVSQSLNDQLTAKAQYVSGAQTAVEIETTQNYTADFGQQSGSRILGVIEANGETYVKVDRALGALSGNYRSGWVNTKFEPRGIPGLESLDVEAFKESVAFPLPFNIPREGVTSIREQAKTEIDGQPVRVFTVRIEARRAGDKTAFEKLLYNFALEELVPYQAAINTALGGAMVVDMTISIGEVDNRVYRVDLSATTTANVTAQFPKDTLPTGTAATVSQTLTASYVYSSFNLPMRITTPEGVTQ